MKTMLSSSAAFLFILLTGSASNCFPVLESDDVNIGNWLNDEFLDESASTFLDDPIGMKSYIAFPRLSLHLQPPSIDFQVSIEDTAEEDFSKAERMKYPPKKSVTPSSSSQPSQYLEPPIREFGSNPKKTVSTYYPVYSPIPLLKNLKTPSLNLNGYRTAGLLTYGSTIPQRLAGPIFAASLPSTSLLRASPRSLQTEAMTTRLSEIKVKDQKKTTKMTLKDRKFTKKTKTDKPEGKVLIAIPEFEEPSRIMLPPTKGFAIQVSRILMPPAREFMSSDSE